MKDLSIIVLSYNTKGITSQCVESIIQSLSGEANSEEQSLKYEIIVVDNGSTDGSREMLQRFPIKTIFLSENLGYSKANNIALKQCQGRYVLFLNSDVLIDNVQFERLIQYMDVSPQIGILTTKITLSNGKIDPASHRGFPTLWRSFCYFAGLERIFGRIPLTNRVFGGYHLLGRNLNIPHEIDSPTGAFLLIRKEILDKLKGFDEDFFMYGEDLDLSYRVKKLGYAVQYNPSYSVLHLKYSSGLKNKDDVLKKAIHKHFYDAMRIFYHKHYEKTYPKVVNKLVYSLIELRKKTL